MNAIYSLLITSIVAGFVTNTFAFFLHRANWHYKVKKSPISFLNLFVTNIYQFNVKLFGPVSISVSIATSIILGNAFYIIFYCDALSFTFCDVSKIFLGIVAFRVAMLLVCYTFCYDKRFVQE